MVLLLLNHFVDCGFLWLPFHDELAMLLIGYLS